MALTFTTGDEIICPSSYTSIIIEKIPDLTLESKKTQIFRFIDNKVKNLSGVEAKVNYLGFTFDGKKISIRDKTLSKYYSRVYKKVKTIVKHRGISKNGNNISCRELYSKYSIRGANQKSSTNKNGNFLTYVIRAKKIFKSSRENLDYKNMDHILKVNMKKIRKRLNK